MSEPTTGPGQPSHEPNTAEPGFSHHGRPAQRKRARRSSSPEYRRRDASRERCSRALPRPEARKTSRKHRSTHKHRDSSARAADASSPGMGLPYSARPLTKTDLTKFESLFAYYLSVQKQKELADMDERETRGRWKSFVHKWNRSELAEGWYDPEMFARISDRSPEPQGLGGQDQDGPPRSRVDRIDQEPVSGSDADDYGPVLPTLGRTRRVGARVPNAQDISMRDDMEQESRDADWEDLRAARKADRVLQKERQDELVPRADAGTRERKLEKRKETNDKMREFREKSPGMEVGDEKEMMGGGDSLQEYKTMKQKEQRRKTEREVRREEMDRVKREEVEERRRAWQEREEGTVSMLRELARQRFG